MKARTEKVFPGEHLISQLLNEIAYTYFPMRAAGDEILARFGQTTAEWGLMRSLEAKGPRTVAALARSRPVARQWIQRLANQLAMDRLIEFVDNPEHKRAKLMRLTPEGQRLLHRIAAEFEPWAAQLEKTFDPRTVRLTLDLLRQLREWLSIEFRKLRSRRSGSAHRHNSKR